VPFDKLQTMNMSAKDKKVPQVSIGLPVYNGELFVREALDSLLDQTFKDFELIISDNASTDSTGSICNEYAKRDTRIRYIRQTKNIGAVPNFKFVLDEAAGEYFMWAAADDIRSPDCIETYLKYIGKAGGIFTTYAIFDRKTNTISKSEIIILSENYTNNKLLRIFFKKLDTDLLWGLYKRKLIINLPLPNFDWFDAYFMIRVLNDFKFITINTTDPKWFRGIYGTYIVKPLFGSYLQPRKYFFRALPYAIKSGGLSIFYHIKTVLKSYLINFRIFKKKLKNL
jgi:glycosyltransferase involved in cell wall biosynthesis